MTLNHSKTWPVSTLAVVQLRVDPNGRTYSTQFDSDLTDFQIAQHTTDELLHNDVQEPEDIARFSNGTGSDTNNGCLREAANLSLQSPPSPLPTTDNKNGSIPTLALSQRHIELFTVHDQPKQHPLASPPPRQRHPYKTTVRTDTVSTILEQDQDNNDIESIESVPVLQEERKAENRLKYEKFHVLALAKIDETSEIDRARTPIVKVENWDGRKLCPACTVAAAAAANGLATTPSDGYKARNSPGDYNDRLLVDLPLDARKATTLRRHYYPEGGWGWVIITCTVLVHVLNIGLQLSCSQLAPSGAEKFKTTQVHIAVLQSESKKSNKIIGKLSTGDENPDFKPNVRLWVAFPKFHKVVVAPQQPPLLPTALQAITER